MSLTLSLLFSVVLGLALALFYEYLADFNMLVAGKISNHGMLSPIGFSLTDSVYSLYNSSNFRELFYHKSFGGAKYYSGSLITGATDLFRLGYRGEAVYSYLSGRAFMPFIALGILIRLSGVLKEAQLYTLFAVFAGFLLTGNPFLFMLFILLESPLLLVSFVSLNALSFAASYALKLSVGFVNEPSFAELIINLDKPVYTIACSIVFTCAAYFVSSYIYEKYGISNSFNLYIPSRLNSLVKALGGVNNLIRFKNESLEVRNPEIVNTLYFDCEINENVISSENKDFVELSAYL